MMPPMNTIYPHGMFKPTLDSCLRRNDRTNYVIPVKTAIQGSRHDVVDEHHVFSTIRGSCSIVPSLVRMLELVVLGCAVDREVVIGIGL